MEIRNKALEGILNDRFGPGASPTAFLSTLVPNAIGLLFVVGAVIFFFMLVIGAVQWISSGGDKANVESARGKLTNALIGLIVLFASFAIIKLIEAFFGVKILELDIAPLVIQ